MLSTGTIYRVPFAWLPRRLLAQRGVATAAEVSAAADPAPPSPPPPPPVRPKSIRKMSGWQLHCYGDIDELQFSEKLKLPSIRSSEECLVRVRTTTVNPIDLAMLGGYGSTLLNKIRCQYADDIEFPLTLGREFCGELVQKGMGVCDEKLQLGSRVWGVVPVHNTAGAHADYVVVPSSCVSDALHDLNTDFIEQFYLACASAEGTG